MKTVSWVLHSPKKVASAFSNKSSILSSSSVNPYFLDSPCFINAIEISFQTVLSQ